MSDAEKRPLKAFLCHASGDKPPVRDLYKRLTTEGVDAWLDKEKLLPGQDWRLEIPRAVREADVVVICLSKKSITKEGYVQKEIKFALDIAEEKPEGTIFLIPARLEDCIVPERLSRWHWVDLYEDDGFIKLLRSLKLRADAVGATVEPDLYADSAKETDRRLEQLYTEGLAAFYTEDWDRACRCFQSILSERPNHKNASEKLEEAERQRNLSKLYEQATGAVRSEDWGIAIQILEELSNKSAEYKDAAQLLRDARKQKQLRDLYAEARALHAGKQWEAVVKVFEQISSIDPNYPDAGGLLPSAQKEVAELKRVAELNEQYSHALREMDAGKWYEARRLLESVHKSETRFLETEKLLKKVENEIVKEEQRRKQNDQINTLYEQAHGLLRSKKWRNALDKMGEIRKLDEHFPDTDGIAEKAQKELAREEQEAERQNKLAALYAEAVKLLKEEKFQEALDKWGEVKAIDPKYPDRQRVHNTARKVLSKQVESISAKPRFVMPKTLWIGLGGIGAIAVLIFAINQFGMGGNNVSLASTMVPTDVVVENTATVAMSTKTPQKTSSPRPATSVSTTSVFTHPTIGDEFVRKNYEGNYDNSMLAVWINGKSDNGSANIFQESGSLSIVAEGDQRIWLIIQSYNDVTISKPVYFEAKLMLDPSSNNSDMLLTIRTSYGAAHCGPGDYGYPTIQCWRNFFSIRNDEGSVDISPGTWHSVGLEVNPELQTITSYIDHQKIQTYTPTNAETIMNSNFMFSIELNNWSSTQSIGYLDYIHIYPLE